MRPTFFDFQCMKKSGKKVKLENLKGQKIIGMSVNVAKCVDYALIDERHKSREHSCPSNGECTATSSFIFLFFRHCYCCHSLLQL